MKKFTELSLSTQEELKEICKTDEYGLSPEFLYKNIFGSNGDIKTLAKLFEVSESLILNIKKEGESNKN